MDYLDAFIGGTRLEVLKVSVCAVVFIHLAVMCLVHPVQVHSLSYTLKFALWFDMLVPFIRLLESPLWPERLRAPSPLPRRFQ